MNSHVVELIFNLNTQRSNFIHECFRSDEKSVLKIYETQIRHLIKFLTKFVILLYSLPNSSFCYTPYQIRHFVNFLTKSLTNFLIKFLNRFLTKILTGRFLTNFLTRFLTKILTNFLANFLTKFLTNFLTDKFIYQA